MKFRLHLLGAFGKLRKATIIIVMSVYLSVRPSVSLSIRMEQLGSHLTSFHEIWYFRIFRKCIETIQVSLKSDRNNRTFVHLR